MVSVRLVPAVLPVNERRQTAQNAANRIAQKPRASSDSPLKCVAQSGAATCDRPAPGHHDWSVMT